ncbi:MAG TPA: VWA domain-containing protein [Mycobacteriales bacterium]|nr:VWA domain-containing protein [Mycobacteriales bacterium]
MPYRTISATTAHGGATGAVVGFALSLRAAGLTVSSGQVQTAVSCLAALDASRTEDVYWSGRLALCSNASDHPTYDAVFRTYFGGGAVRVARPAVTSPPVLRLLGTDAVSEPLGDGPAAARSVAATASAAERLRHRDIAAMGPAERAELHRLLTAWELSGLPRRSRRYRPAATGPVDPRRTLRVWMQAGGEPSAPRRRTRREQPRRVVLLVDVSGSMGGYATALLRFAHAARRSSARIEVFALGTRLTRLTRELARRDPDIAMTAVAAAAPDAGSGTRLGLLLKEFLDCWGQRSLARGAVVVVLSDGWERGDVTVLERQMARLHRLAYRVVWSNPRKAAPGFAPLAAGMAAALPHVDAFVEGHSLAALEHLAAVVQGGPA